MVNFFVFLKLLFFALLLMVSTLVYLCKLHIYKHKHENKGLENKLQRSLYESSPKVVVDICDLVHDVKAIFHLPYMLRPSLKIVLFAVTLPRFLGRVGR